MPPPSRARQQAPEPPAWWYEVEPETVAFGLRLRLLHAEETPFQRLELYEHDVLGRLLVLDGALQTTQHDEFIYNEMLTHVPLLGGLGPAERRSILILGGGDGGVLREVLRHETVERVVMVEIDRRVVELTAEYLGFHGDYDDPRVELVFDDAAAYVRRAGVQAHPFDALLIDSTDPVGPGAALFTEAFLNDARACLQPHGVLARHLCMVPFQPEILRAGYARLRRLFEGVAVYQATIPTYLGAHMAFVAAGQEERSVREPRQELTGRYYNPDVHRAAFALPTWWRDEVMTG